MPDLAMLDYFYGDEAEQFTFYRIPKVLFTDPSYRRISSDAKILYGLMLDRMGLSVRNGWLDEYNRVFIFFTLEDALEYLCCGHTKAVSLFGELDKAGLIERKKQGQGKPTKIYVKNFVRNAEVLTSEKRKSKVPQSGSQDFQKTASNNTEIKDTELSDTEPSIYPVRGLPEDKSPAADAMDLTTNTGENPLLMKADFIMSFCELILSAAQGGLKPIEKSVIDRCIPKIYRQLIKDPRPENMPILGDLYECLRAQQEEQAQELATALELYDALHLPFDDAPFGHGCGAGRIGQRCARLHL